MFFLFPLSYLQSQHRYLLIDFFNNLKKKILNDYQSLNEEKQKQQQLYFLVSNRHLTDEISNSFPPSSFSSSLAPLSYSSLLEDIIPADQIFDETIATSQHSLLSSMISLLKFLDALRVRMQKSYPRHRWSDHPAIHLIFYPPEFQTEIYEHVWQTLLSMNPSLDFFVESRVEVISPDPETSAADQQITIPPEAVQRLRSQQIKELDEIFKGNKIRNMNDLERYLALGGKKKITYL